MTLPEAFEKYDDTVKLRRKSFYQNFVKSGRLTQEQLDEFLSNGVGSNDIEWLKGMYAWGNEESREMGFIIPQFMIDNAQADDWEVYEPVK